MIEAVGLSKRYGSTLAVDDLSFTMPPGQVTGFLGPNGTGKSTTMRLILGLDVPSAGSVTVDGRPYAAHPRPLFQVGALPEAKAAHPGRSAYNHLRCLARSNGIERARVEEVLAQVGLTKVAHKRAGGFSLGMAQRLGIATALLGDPPVLILDEPVNGLDPEGVLWVRNLVKALAAQGRTVFLSSHLMSEMAITADRLIIIGHGRPIAETTVDGLLKSGTGSYVQIRTPHSDSLATALQARGARVTRVSDDTLHAHDVEPDLVGELARLNGIKLLELSTQHASLEQRYMELTSDAADCRTRSGSHTGHEIEVSQP